MDLQKFEFPTDTTTNKELLAEAEARGFLHAHSPYNELFSDLFYKGGKVVFKKGIDEAFRNRAWMYCRALMRSWFPKHEHKEAVCAMLMSEILEPKLEKETA